MHKTIEVIKDIRTLCTHIFEGGHRCASPALQRETFCYYHHPTRRPTQKSSRRRRGHGFNLPLPSGRQNLQHAVYEVIRRLAADRITNRQAGMLLKALDNLSRNSPPAPTASSPQDATAASAPSSSPARAHTPSTPRAPVPPRYPSCCGSASSATSNARTVRNPSSAEYHCGGGSRRINS